MTVEVVFIVTCPELRQGTTRRRGMGPRRHVAKCLVGIHRPHSPGFCLLLDAALASRGLGISDFDHGQSMLKSAVQRMHAGSYLADITLVVGMLDYFSMVSVCRALRIITGTMSVFF